MRDNSHKEDAYPGRGDYGDRVLEPQSPSNQRKYDQTEPQLVDPAATDLAPSHPVGPTEQQPSTARFPENENGKPAEQDHCSCKSSRFQRGHRRAVFVAAENLVEYALGESSRDDDESSDPRRAQSQLLQSPQVGGKSRLAGESQEFNDEADGDNADAARKENTAEVPNDLSSGFGLVGGQELPVFRSA